MVHHITMPFQFEAALCLYTEASTTPRFSCAHIPVILAGNPDPSSIQQDDTLQNLKTRNGSFPQVKRARPFPEKAFQSGS